MAITLSPLAIAVETFSHLEQRPPLERRVKRPHVRSGDLLAGGNVLQGHDLHAVVGVDDGAGVWAAAVVQHGGLQVERVHVLQRHFGQHLTEAGRDGGAVSTFKPKWGKNTSPCSAHFRTVNSLPLSLPPSLVAVGVQNAE